MAEHIEKELSQDLIHLQRFELNGVQKAAMVSQAIIPKLGHRLTACPNMKTDQCRMSKGTTESTDDITRLEKLLHEFITQDHPTISMDMLFATSPPRNILE